MIFYQFKKYIIIFLQRLQKNSCIYIFFILHITHRQVIGVSPSGKASAFGADIVGATSKNRASGSPLDEAALLSEVLSASERCAVR